jgi:hypothetical protein
LGLILNRSKQRERSAESESGLALRFLCLLLFRNPTSDAAPGWVLGFHSAAVADRRYKDYFNFTVLHGAMIARYWKKRLRTVRTIF